MNQFQTSNDVIVSSITAMDLYHDKLLTNQNQGKNAVIQKMLKGKQKDNQFHEAFNEAKPETQDFIN